MKKPHELVCVRAGVTKSWSGNGRKELACSCHSLQPGNIKKEAFCFYVNAFEKVLGMLAECCWRLFLLGKRQTLPEQCWQRAAWPLQLSALRKHGVKRVKELAVVTAGSQSSSSGPLPSTGGSEAAPTFHGSPCRST